MDERNIREWINQKLPELVETLKAICRVRSVAETQNPSCKPYGEGCKRVLQDMLTIGREAGFSTENFEDHVGRISYPGKKEENIAIWAHLDVVDEGDDWDYAPYDPIVKDDYFIARGCQDNKSSAVMGLYVLKYMKEHGISLNHTLDLYLGICEEQGMHDLDHFTAHHTCPALSLVPDSGFPVCCGERGSFNGELIQQEPVSGELLDITCDCGQYTVPDKACAVLRYTEERWAKCTASSIENPESGIETSQRNDKVVAKHMQMIDERTGTDTENTKLTFENIDVVRKGEEIHLLAKGISTQAANPDKGDSALSRLAEFICRQELLSESDLRAFALAKDINRNHNGDALDVFCQDILSGSMVMTVTQLSLRQEPDGRKLPVLGFISKFPITQNEVPYEERAGKAAAKRGFDLKVSRLSKANYFDPERPVVKCLTQCSNEVLGRQDEPFVMSGGTYARKLPNAFAFGTGMPLPNRPESLFRPGHGDYHQPDESISLERIRRALEIYIKGILRIDELDISASSDFDARTT